jgi:hypothetical protein
MTVRVFEAGTNVGGTWYWNRYPGARFDNTDAGNCRGLREFFYSIKKERTLASFGLKTARLAISRTKGRPETSRGFLIPSNRK